MAGRRRSLEDRVAAVVLGRTRSARRIGDVLTLVRRADRIDLLEVVHSAGPARFDEAVRAALGSTAANVRRRNEARREVFVRFATTSRRVALLDDLRDLVAGPYAGDEVLRNLVDARLRALAGPPPTLAEGAPSLVAEQLASTHLGALLATSIELDLLAAEMGRRYGGSLEASVEYRLRRSLEAVRRELGRIGIEPFGTPGETVPFDARQHEYIGLAERVAMGMPVQLVTRGYHRARADRGRILSKAQVE